MDNDRIVKFADEAGVHMFGQGDEIKALVALVEQHVRADEREKNAIRCDAISNRYTKPDEAGYRIAAEWCAAEIRSAK